VELTPFASWDGEPVIADGEIDFAIGTDNQAMEVVAVEGSVDTEATEEGFWGDIFSGIEGVTESPEAGVSGGEHGISPGHDACEHTADFFVEPFGEEGRVRCFSGLARVFEASHPFFDSHEIAPIVRAIAVMIGEPFCIVGAPFGGHAEPEEATEVFDT